jgi:hypothetical protein
MNCHDFERVLNEQLDARCDASAEVERFLETHASACAPCREVAARYATLRQVLLASGPAPVPPADFVDRFLTAGLAVPPRRTLVIPLRTWGAALAIAASLLVIVAAPGRFGADRARPGPVHATAPRVKAIDPQSLTVALALARSATLDLARDTSGPATRIGREVLESATVNGTPSLSMDVPVTTSSDVLRNVGERVTEGVGPLSGTARHAFSFLLVTPKAAPKS